MEMTMKIPTDFRDLLYEFKSANVEFLIVGAFALAAHGLPRFTGDIDLYYRATTDNAERILIALRRFGILSSDVDKDLLLQPEAVLFFGHPPVRIDLLNDIDGVSFEHAWENRDYKQLGDIEVPVLSLKHLAINKEASGRAKDSADLILIRQLMEDL